MAISLPCLFINSVCGVLFAVLWEKHKFYFDHFSPMHHVGRYCMVCAVIE